jgi:nucleoside-diphosphate-sugar epimerase
LRFEKADITDDAAMDRLIDEHRNCLAIIHLAAIVGDPACKLEPDLARKTNLDATVRLVKMAAASGIARFVFASTCSNYGKMKEIGGYVDEDSPLAPVSLYAELKVGAEQFILSTMPKTDGFCPTCLRFATVYGLSPRMRFDLTVNEFTRDIALGREVVVFGEQFWRPYCHVRDFSKAILAVLRECREKVAYRVFNVGDTAENYTKRMLMEELLRLEPGGRVKYVRKEEDPRDYRVNFARIRRELNFRISRTVPQGMKDILTSLRLGVVPDPDHQRYHNTPLVT